MEHPFSNEEMRLAELLHQFLALSDDQDNAGRIIFRGPHGEYIGEAKLSARDIAAATDALVSLNAAKDATEEATRPRRIELPEVSAEDLNALIGGAESWLKTEGGQA
jgi:hypothetical protein